MGLFERGGCSINGILYPLSTIESTHWFDVIFYQKGAKWANHPPTGICGWRKVSGGRISVFSKERGSSPRGESTSIPSVAASGATTSS